MNKANFPAEDLERAHAVDTVTPGDLRSAFRGFATGLAVVAAHVEDAVVGLPANSLVSVSLDPPLVSVAFARTSSSWPLLRRASHWGISILGEDHADVLDALRRPAPHRFDGIDVHIDERGPVFIAGALATLMVSPFAEVDAGDHVLTLLTVHSTSRDVDQRPLVFFDSTTHFLSH